MKTCDLCKKELQLEYIDGRIWGKTTWANMCPACWKKEGYPKLGVGFGQLYRRPSTKDLSWTKVQG